MISEMQMLAFLLEDVALLAARLDQPATALELIGAADRLREELAAPRSDASDARLEAQLEQSLGSVPARDRADAHARGRQRDLAESLRRVIRLCRADRANP